MSRHVAKLRAVLTGCDLIEHARACAATVECPFDTLVRVSKCAMRTRLHRYQRLWQDPTDEVPPTLQVA